MLTIDLTAPATGYLDDILGRLANPRPFLLELGEELRESTLLRFATSTGPDGTAWAPNRPVTILRYLAGRGGVYSQRDGRLTKKGADLVAGKKPLIGETRHLSTTINTRVVDGHTLLVGSPEKYAGVQQFGADAGSLGGGAPWGTIPARPFLGISAQDERTITDLLASYLAP